MIKVLLYCVGIFMTLFLYFLVILLIIVGIFSLARAELIPLSPTIYMEETSVRGLLDSQTLMILVQTNPDGSDIMPGIKSIITQVILDCKVKGREKFGITIAFSLPKATGEVVAVQPADEKAEWQVFEKPTSAAVHAWERGCIY
jgi:hypothetical protein